MKYLFINQIKLQNFIIRMKINLTLLLYNRSSFVAKAIWNNAIMERFKNFPTSVNDI